MKKSFLFLYLIGLGLLFTNCENAKPIETETQKLTATAEGPLFSGINTATAEFNISAVLPEGIKPENISSAKISSININSLVENPPTINSFTVLIASPKQEMTQVAFLNDKDKAEKNMSMAEDQSAVTAVLKDESQTLVIDFDLSEDWLENWNFEVEIKWEITVSQ